MSKPEPMKPPESAPRPLTDEERERAEIEALEMERHAYTMLAAAKEKRLAALGKTYKKKRVVDKEANCC